MDIRMDVSIIYLEWTQRDLNVSNWIAQCAIQPFIQVPSQSFIRSKGCKGGAVGRHLEKVSSSSKGETRSLFSALDVFMSRCDAWNCGSPLVTMRKASLGTTLIYRDMEKVWVLDEVVKSFLKSLYLQPLCYLNWEKWIVRAFCIKIHK